MLNKIKTLLDIEVKLEEMKLENGTVVEAESFEKGKEIFIITDEEKVALPVGEYILESGQLLIISEEGIIADMREVSDEVPQKEGEEITEDMYDDKEKKMEEDDDMKEKEMADVGDWKGMEKRIQNLEDAISDLKGDKEGKMEEVVEEDLKEESEGVLKSRTVKEEFNEVEEKVKEELSKPSSNPIKHSPESKKSVKPRGFLYSQNRTGTALDRVLSRLNK
jgi:hypothetical protein